MLGEFIRERAHLQEYSQKILVIVRENWVVAAALDQRVEVVHLLSSLAHTVEQTQD